MSDQIQNSNLVPNADNTISLGSNSNRFSDVYATEFHGVATYSGSSLSISNHNLGNLGDVTLSSVSSGDVLVWTGTTWSANSICNPTHLDNLTDVDTSGVTSGQVLRYNSTSGKWEAQTITPGSIGTTFVTLSDTPNSLTPNAFLKVNAGGTAIENFADPGYISDLTSFTTTNLTEGTNLYYTDTRFDTRFATKDTDDLSEGSNQYFTNARFDSRLSLKTTTNLTEGTNLYYTDTRFDTRFNTKSTTDLAEGSNLYFTNTRADARINLQTGANLDLSNKSTTDLAEGSNLYYTDARADTRINTIVTKPFVDNLYSGSNETSDDIAEGTTNLYYTNARFDTRLATKSTTNLAEGTNLYYTDARADARVNLQTGANLDLSSKSTTDLSEGSNQYFTNARVDTRIGATSINALSDVDTVSSAPTTGQVLKWNGSKWAPGTNGNSSNANVSTDADTLDGFNSSYFLDYNNFTNTPTIPATTDDLAEGSNLYYTDARADTRFDTKFATKSTTNLAEGTNLYYTDTRWDNRLATKTTDDLAEGTNKFYTDSKFDTRFATKTTADLTENPSYLYYTDARANSAFDTRLVTKSTDDITEGSTNLYYTTARANAAIDARLSGVTTDFLPEGVLNEYYTNTKVDTRISASSINALSDVDTVSSAPTVGQVLKWDGSKWAPGVDVTTGGAGTDADTLDGQDGSYYLDYNNLVNTPSGGGSGPVNTDALAEGSTNLYYTTTRANADFDTRLATKSTTNLTEGTNLYYTNARFDTQFNTKTTDDLPEGTKKYFTNQRVKDALIGTTTDDLPEGTTNLYYTAAKVNTIISNSTLSDLSGVNVNGATNGQSLVYNSSNATWIASTVSGGGSGPANTDALAEGSTNLYYTDARVNNVLQNSTVNYIPDTDNSVDVGSSSNRIRNIHVANLYTDSIAPSPSLSGTYTISSPTTITLDPVSEVIADAPFRLKSYSSGNLPSGSAGAMISISDNGYKPAYHDGSTWRYVYDNSTV